VSGLLKLVFRLLEGLLRLLESVSRLLNGFLGLLELGLFWLPRCQLTHLGGSFLLPLLSDRLLLSKLPRRAMGRNHMSKSSSLLGSGFWLIFFRV
jgi:hypothetical protein